MLRSLFALLIVALATAGESESLREEIADLEFLNRLDLDREQARTILPIAVEGALLRREFERDRDRLTERLHDALVRFREEDLRDQGLSPEVTALAGGTDHLLKVLGSRLASAYAPLEARARPMLTPRQAALAFPLAEERHPLDQLRELWGSNYEELRDTLARMLARARVKAGLVERTEDRAERLRIRTLLRDVSRWEESEYRARRDAVLDDLVPGRERAAVAAEIGRIHAMRYGRAGPLGEHLFKERMLPALARRAEMPPPKLPAREGESRSVSSDMERMQAEVAALKADINLLNLVNGLHLDVRQLKAILRGAKECAAAAGAGETREEREVVDSLRRVRDSLLRGEEPPPSAMQALRPADAIRGEGYLAARRREVEEARTGAVDGLMVALSPGQKRVIRDYAPCLVPPKNLRDPVRAGQANDTEALELLLDRVRATDLGVAPEEGAEKILREIESLHGAFPPEERDCKRMLLLGIAWEAQSLDPVDYLARREDLASRLEPLHRLDALKERLHGIDGDDVTVRGKIAAFLLDARMIPLAADRLARLAQPEEIARPDLPKAEVCEEGECGKP